MPCSQTDWVPVVTVWLVDPCIGRLFHTPRTSRSAAVWKVCGSCPAPGTDWTGVPAATVTVAGAPGAVSAVKTRSASAATPGRSS